MAGRRTVTPSAADRALRLLGTVGQCSVAPGRRSREPHRFTRAQTCPDARRDRGAALQDVRATANPLGGFLVVR